MAEVYTREKCLVDNYNPPLFIQALIQIGPQGAELMFCLHRLLDWVAKLFIMSKESDNI
jgi:hypothetical protein